MRIDELLPEYQVRTWDEVTIAGTPEMIFKSLRDLDLSDSMLVRSLFRLRGLPISALRLGGLVRMGFTELAVVPNREYVLGIVGQFWKPSGSLLRLKADQFAGFNRPGFNKAAWNFSVHEYGAEAARLATETRVASYGRSASVLFRLYWSLIAPFSAMIRREILRSIESEVEFAKKGDRA